MKKMLYTSKMPQVTVTVLPDGKRDVTVLVNEEEIADVVRNMPESDEPLKETLQPNITLEESLVDETLPEELPLPDAPQEESLPDESLPEPSVMYQYDGNQFRTVYELTEEEVLANLDKYLHYDSADEPTLEQLAHDHALIDSFTMELMEGGLL